MLPPAAIMPSTLRRHRLALGRGQVEFRAIGFLVIKEGLTVGSLVKGIAHGVQRKALGRRIAIEQMGAGYRRALIMGSRHHILSRTCRMPIRLIG
jgi:hypothetical protein